MIAGSVSSDTMIRPDGSEKSYFESRVRTLRILQPYILHGNCNSDSSLSISYVAVVDRTESNVAVPAKL